MRFVRLDMENIRSYEKLTVNFDKGRTLLSGDIGSGKTSILLGLQFALFGLQPGQKGGSIIRNGEKEAFAKLEIDLDGKNVILERRLKASNTGAITQTNSKITINGQVEELSTSEIKNRVIGLLDYPKEFAKKSNLLYKFTVYTPQEDMKAIIQERPEIRLDTLRHIFGIDRYKRIKENTQIFLQKIKEGIKLKEGQTMDINVVREKISQINENKIQLGKEINNLKIEVDKIKEEKTLSEGNLKAIEEKVKEKNVVKQEIEKKKIELNGKNSLKQRLEREIISMKNQIKEPLEFNVERLKHVAELIGQHKKNLDQMNEKYMQLNSRISVLNSEKERVLGLKEKVVSLENCPTCLQPVKEEYKERLGKKTQYDLEEIDREVLPKMNEREQIIKDIDSEKKLIRDYEADLSNLEKEKIKFQHRQEIDTKIKSDSFVLDRTFNEIEQINVKISELENKLSLMPDVEGEFEERRKQLNEVSSRLQKVEISFAEKTREVEMIRKRFEELNAELISKEEKFKQLGNLRELQDWLNDKFLPLMTTTEKNVLAKLRQDFSEIFNKWFVLLVSDSLSARLDEDFTPVITNQDYDIDYDFLSGGERTAVALAYRLALNQMLNSMVSRIKTKNVMILDEPTDGFSQQQLDKMRDILEQLDTEQILIVSHETKIESFVDHVIQVKKDGVSGVEVIEG
jgi:exonuclease SbcC